MKKMNAAILAVAGTLMASTAAMADTSTTDVSAQAPKLIDKIVASYWGAYSGPSITDPTAKTIDSDSAEMKDLQNLDSTLTGGYRIAPNMTLNGNYRFILRPTLSDEFPKITERFQSKDPWVSLKHSKLIHLGTFNLSGEVRGYVPATTYSKGLNTALRTNQTATYDVPKTRLTLGTYTIERANFLKEGSELNNLQLDLAAFTSYQMTSTLAATTWTDLAQYDVYFGTPLANKPIDVALGVNWDVTPNISLNPQFTFFPASATIDKTTIGAILSAKFL
jgi:hypothetical protein